MVRLLDEQAADLAARVGAPVELVGVAVRRLDAPRDVAVARGAADHGRRWGSCPRRRRPGRRGDGRHRARPRLLLAALETGASVVTANKALLAEDGPTLFEAADQAGRDLYFEAAVGGAIPILRPLRESLAGDSVRRVLGIVNGTTNFVLDQMDTTGAGFAEALEEAQALGYAEADPTADVEGFDAAAKAAILASLAFHSRVTAGRRATARASPRSPPPTCSRRATGTPSSSCSRSAELRDGAAVRRVAVRVHPALIPRSHPLAGVRGAYNAVFVEAEAAGQLMFYGPGAGGSPTASAVLGDLVTVARHRVLAGTAAPASRRTPTAPCCRWRSTAPATRSRLDVDDRPGVLAQVALAFAEHDVSRSRPCARRAATPDAQLVVVSHEATDAQLSATVEHLRGMDDRARGRLGAARRRRVRVTTVTPFAPTSGAASSPSTATCLRGPRGHRRGDPGRGWHRRWCPPSGCPGLTGAEVWLKVEGINPTGSFKDRGMTAAISAAAARRRPGRRVRLDRQHVGLGGGVRRARPASGLLVLVPEGKIADGQAEPGRRCTARR